MLPMTFHTSWVSVRLAFRAHQQHGMEVEVCVWA